jgi:DNA-binding beta-propeller fold protein YncE
MLGRNLITSAAGNAAEAEIEWDIANASFDGSGQNFFSIISEETALTGGTFKPDGTKMYIIGTQNRNVNEYNLSTAWDVSTASHVQSFSVQSQDLSPKEVQFKTDGTKMYVAGDSGNDINEYDLSTAWDISSASYSQNFSVSSEGTSPTGLYFKGDGTKMYVSDSAGDEVNEYDLSTAWDVSTASYNQRFSVSGQDTTPRGVVFRDDGGSDDGKKMYIVGDSGNDINEYTLTTAWDISTASYSRNFAVSSQDTNPCGVFFKNDGSDMFVFGSKTKSVYKYDLTTAWQVSPASYQKPTTDYLSVSSQESNPETVFFKGDGSKMFVAGRTGDDVNEYTLSTAWSVQTASYSQVFSVSAQETDVRGIFFRNDGTAEDGKQMYVTGTSGDDVNEYSLSTAWDVSTASYTQNFSVSSESTTPHAVSFKSDGTKMFVLDNNTRNIFRYSLSTAWDISTASYDGSAKAFAVGSQETGPTGLYFKDDGTRMYVVGITGDDVNQYELSTAWDVSTASYSKNFSVAYLGQNPSGIFFKPDGAKFFVTDTGTDSVSAFTIS